MNGSVVLATAWPKWSGTCKANAHQCIPVRGPHAVQEMAFMTCIQVMRSMLHPMCMQATAVQSAAVLGDSN